MQDQGENDIINLKQDQTESMVQVILSVREHDEDSLRQAMNLSHRLQDIYRCTPALQHAWWDVSWIPLILPPDEESPLFPRYKLQEIVAKMISLQDDKARIDYTLWVLQESTSHQSESHSFTPQLTRQAEYINKQILSLQDRLQELTAEYYFLLSQKPLGTSSFQEFHHIRENLEITQQWVQDNSWVNTDVLTHNIRALRSKVDDIDNHVRSLPHIVSFLLTKILWKDELSPNDITEFARVIRMRVATESLKKNVQARNTSINDDVPDSDDELHQFAENLSPDDNEFIESFKMHATDRALEWDIITNIIQPIQELLKNNTNQEKGKFKNSLDSLLKNARFTGKIRDISYEFNPYFSDYVLLREGNSWNITLSLNIQTNLSKHVNTSSGHLVSSKLVLEFSGNSNDPLQREKINHATKYILCHKKYLEWHDFTKITKFRNIDFFYDSLLEDMDKPDGISDLEFSLQKQKKYIEEIKVFFSIYAQLKPQALEILEENDLLDARIFDNKDSLLGFIRALVTLEKDKSLQSMYWNPVDMLSLTFHGDITDSNGEVTKVPGTFWKYILATKQTSRVQQDGIHFGKSWAKIMFWFAFDPTPIHKVRLTRDILLCISYKYKIHPSSKYTDGIIVSNDSGQKYLICIRWKMKRIKWFHFYPIFSAIVFPFQHDLDSRVDWLDELHQDVCQALTEWNEKHNKK